tara:strand:- start:316 stop:492 length:177 start_codon:yes stop_codon:yes gene_type:complete
MLNIQTKCISFSEELVEIVSKLDPDTKAVKKAIFGFWQKKDNTGAFNTEISVQEVAII